MDPSGPKTRTPDAARALESYFDALRARFGPQRWWPARTRLEIILGAILTQNTAWRNAALALRELRRAGLLRQNRLLRTPAARLARHIRPAGFFRQKARTIRNFLGWLDKCCHGSLDKLFAQPPEEARRGLLSIKGLGPETVDSILLYAGRRPYFVADAYTRRVLFRHGLILRRSSYAASQAFIHENLRRDYIIYNEYHALLVEVGKRHCVKSAPKCDACPLKPYLPHSGPVEPV